MVTTELAGQGIASTLRSRRIIINLILSANFYMLYWFYLTWKQLKVQTQRDYHPVWHTLALLVPIYNLFVLHRHLKTIRELQAEAGLTSPVKVGTIFTLWIIGGVLDFQSTRLAEISAVAEAIVLLIGTGFIAGALILAQRGLNAYWASIGGESARDARIGVGEIIFVLLGLAYWILVFLP